MPQYKKKPHSIKSALSISEEMPGPNATVI